MKRSRFGDLGLMVANSHLSLGIEVAKILGIEPLAIESKSFLNNEINYRRLGDVSGKDLCILSSLHNHYNTISELKLMCGSTKSASRNFGVFPFVMNGKCDHVKQFGESVAYKDTAHDISSSGIEVAAIFDQHSSQHPGFYDTMHYKLRMVHHMYLMKILIEFAKKNLQSFDSVLAIDDGSFKRNKKIAELLGLGVSFIIKDRDPETRIVSIKNSKIVGKVKGHRVASFDDMLQNGGTLEVSAKIAKHKGAKEITFFVVHDDFSEETFTRINPLLENGTIDKIYILETIPLILKEKWHKNLIVLSPAKFIANVILRIHYEDHMRDLFLEI